MAGVGEAWNEIETRSTLQRVIEWVTRPIQPVKASPTNRRERTRRPQKEGFFRSLRSPRSFAAIPNTAWVGGGVRRRLVSWGTLARLPGELFAAPTLGRFDDPDQLGELYLVWSCPGRLDSFQTHSIAGGHDHHAAEARARWRPCSSAI